MFLRKDEENAYKELECYFDLQKQAIELIEKGKFEDALIYHQNMIWSIGELKRLHNDKLMTDEAELILRQIGFRDQQEVIKNLKGVR